MEPLKKDKIFMNEVPRCTNCTYHHPLKELKHSTHHIFSQEIFTSLYNIGQIKKAAIVKMNSPETPNLWINHIKAVQN